VAVLWRPILGRTPLEGKCQYRRIALVETAQFFGILRDQDHESVQRLIDAFNGPFGKIVAGLIAEGQSEPAILQEFFDRWVSPRRNATIADLLRGKNAGEVRSETEPEVLNDAIFGAIYYRMLLHSGPLARCFGEELVKQVLHGHRLEPNQTIR
jgi:Tetracyclin repressor-like, C-terminal domain